jgi:hypothetical protein
MTDLLKTNPLENPVPSHVQRRYNQDYKPGYLCTATPNIILQGTTLSVMLPYDH